MARKPALKAVGLFDKAPIADVGAASMEDEKQQGAPRHRKRAASTRDETLYSFTLRMRLDQRAKLEGVAYTRKRPTAPGKSDASAVWREFFDECFDAWMEEQ